jgi:hypothetical protein
MTRKRSFNNLLTFGISMDNPQREVFGGFSLLFGDDTDRSICGNTALPEVT